MMGIFCARSGEYGEIASEKVVEDMSGDCGSAGEGVSVESAQCGSFEESVRAAVHRGGRALRQPNNNQQCAADSRSESTRAMPSMPQSGLTKRFLCPDSTLLPVRMHQSCAMSLEIESYTL